MESIIADPIRRDPHLSAGVERAMQILHREAGEFDSIVRAEWSPREESSNGKELVRLVLQYTEFPEHLEQQFSRKEFEDSSKLRDRLHWIWSDVLAQYSRCLRRRTDAMIKALQEN